MAIFDQANHNQNFGIAVFSWVWHKKCRGNSWIAPTFFNSICTAVTWKSL